MNRVHVLDCTLRDGGYCNQWKFGYDNIKKITQGLVDANVDIIECGFLTNKVEYNRDVTKFTSVKEISPIIPLNHQGKLFVAMVNFGEYSVDALPEYDGSSVDGIRVAFHKKDILPSLEYCKAVKEKGYKVFVQAMLSLSYTDEEFLSMIHMVNELEPYAFYIVDSFGMMKKKSLIRLFYMVENNLKEGIWIGFHSHNNMQLAYSNAQSLVDTQTNRNLIIDSSIYGMGRGAGNLNTELFVEYLNENADGCYDLKPLLNVIDEILNGFYQESYWGYSLPNYISAVHWAHPNYASYLSDKNTLTVEAMDEIFAMMPQDKRFEFDKEYIEELYIRYMTSGEAQEEHKAELISVLSQKKVLLIAPGKSIEEEKELVQKFAMRDDVVSVSVNFDCHYPESDYIFSSNLRRFREVEENSKSKCIVTTNIPADNVYLRTNYYNLLLTTESVRDNAGLMAIKFFISLGINEIYLAGFDGYSHDSASNYVSHDMALITKNAVIDTMNTGMSLEMTRMKETANIVFLTKKKFVHC